MTDRLADYIDIVFDGPPSHESGRFVEVENSAGASIRFGKWIHRPDGYWVLRFASRDATIADLTTGLHRTNAAIRAQPSIEAALHEKIADLERQVERLTIKDPRELADARDDPRPRFVNGSDGQRAS